MRLHVFQHVPFEGRRRSPAGAANADRALSVTPWFAGAQAPELEEVDGLIVMGGPMNIYEHRACPWLVEEKKFLTRALGALAGRWSEYAWVRNGTQRTCSVARFTRTRCARSAGGPSAGVPPPAPRRAGIFCRRLPRRSTGMATPSASRPVPTGWRRATIASTRPLRGGGWRSACNFTSKPARNRSAH